MSKISLVKKILLFIQVHFKLAEPHFAAILSLTTLRLQHLVCPKPF